MPDTPEALAGAEIAHLRHELRTPVNQIVGYCEMLLEDVEASGGDAAHTPLASALAAVREVNELIEAALPVDAETVAQATVAELYESLHEPQARIVDAMAELLRDFSATRGADFIADVCRIRDAAERLLPTDRPRAEVTGSFRAPGAVAIPKTDGGARNGKAARILVVDDIEENRGVLQRRLQREGHAVTCAANGAEALRLAEDGGFDIILLDVMMPEMDGYETLERLKSSTVTRDTPVIMISALDDIASIARCIERGAEDYLPKPFDPVLLRARINASLEKKEARERERAYLRDVMRVVSAAVAVEHGGYTSDALHVVAERGDELGTLARVFDSMAAGIRERERRLREQLDRLRDEIGGVEDGGLEEEEGDQLLPNGVAFADRYRIERPIGRGGMGMVYVAHDLELGERVAIKTLRPDVLTSDETAIDRFRNEIRLARRMAHKNVVRTHDFGKAGDVYFVTMEFVEGTTLRALLDRRARLGTAATLAIARQLSDALVCAHDEGIVHRDVKPQNLLLDAAGTLKVTDFGVARLAERASALTQSGLVVGTPAYMSPEQLLDEEVDVRSDLYAVGVVLYECLTGRPPFEAKSTISLIAKILQEQVEPVHVVASDVPQSLSQVVMKLLEKNPADRLQSAGELGELLTRV